MLRYGSICSGIEACSVAWHGLGWEPAFFAEIEPFPCAVLRHRWPGVTNAGDFTKIGAGQFGAIDLLAGGTPCQSFSVAGKRAGLDDPRGDLTLEFVRLVKRLRPRWFVWENVPGVFTLDGGCAFGQILAGFAGHESGFVFEPPESGWLKAGCAEPAGAQGYGVAWRVLDAQYVRVDTHPRAVPQRRQRVFAVGYLGDWRPAAAVLFEPEGLRGDSPPRREAGQGPAPTISSRPTGGGGVGTDPGSGSGAGPDCDGGLVPVNPDVAWALQERDSKGADSDTKEGHLIVAPPLKAEGFDASEDGTGRGTHIVPVAPQAVAFNARQDPVPGDVSGALDDDPYSQAVAFSCKDSGADAGDVSPPLRAMGHDGSHANAGGQVAVAFNATDASPDFSKDLAPTLRSPSNGPGTGAGGNKLAVAYDRRGREGGSRFEGPHETANIRAGSGGSSRSYVADPGSGSGAGAWAVRRLTPRECERLQGFPDDYTAIPWRGLPADTCPDGPRYKALGNSMAVNVMRSIGERIGIVHRVLMEAGT